MGRHKKKREQRGLRVDVRNNNVEFALKKFKRMVKNSGLMLELKKKTYHQKESESDIERRLDRLEETVCSIISHIKEPITWLKNISEEIYEEAEAKRGDQDE